MNFNSNPDWRHSQRPETYVTADRIITRLDSLFEFLSSSKKFQVFGPCMLTYKTDTVLKVLNVYSEEIVVIARSEVPHPEEYVYNITADDGNLIIWINPTSGFSVKKEMLNKLNLSPVPGMNTSDLLEVDDTLLTKEMIDKIRIIRLQNQLAKVFKPFGLTF